jgi:hypothetical protein
MKKSLKTGLLVIMIILGLFLVCFYICVMARDLEISPVMEVIVKVLGLMFIVTWLVYYFDPLYKVVKYRKNEWPQCHKFRWFLVGIGIVHVPFVLVPMIVVWGLGVPTIIVIVILAFLYFLARRRLELVEDAVV